MNSLEGRLSRWIPGDHQNADVRPEFLQPHTHAFLREKNRDDERDDLPQGIVHTTLGVTGAMNSAAEEFKKNEQLRRIHNITSEEMEMLSQVALLGDIRAQRDFIYILHTVRHALGR